MKLIFLVFLEPGNGMIIWHDGEPIVNTLIEEYGSIPEYVLGVDIRKYPVGFYTAVGAFEGTEFQGRVRQSRREELDKIGLLPVDVATVIQRRPMETAGKEAWPLVIQDMEKRNDFGSKKYATPLKVGDGRDSLVDAYQEALDLCVYLRKAIEETL